eukprot:CAMPEP_0183309478 /NCGR_PEP_ID=MMETSP0160_2-20130417/25367_1 /TAXON_ID=2839 ORGANISM="Odontella Sinensis, Strain Grunow 1884" /NCGR_SAMPLE_ID=MMETSP0160_2 /ASSEMBLY_ACC=CAM_ASM_000250 /LENGTH=475 /DNA_ID=CAMNT_0025473515 /DNA_START=115 /DNA_END=1539 /DNA_ORIENTATION=-
MSLRNLIELRKWDDIIRRVECGTVSEDSGVGKCLVEEASRMKAPDGVIRALMALDPNAVSMFSPIHLDRSCAPLSLNILLEAYGPDEIKEIPENGMTALHWACCCGASVDVVRKFVSVFPGAATVKEESEWFTPLHYATNGLADFPTNKELIGVLVSVCPAAVSLMDGNGNTPIFYAIRHEAPASIIETLVDDQNSILGQSNAFGVLPLEHAMDVGASLEIIQVLVRKYPEAASSPNYHGLTPIRRAVRMASETIVRQCSSAISFLLQTHKREITVLLGSRNIHRYENISSCTFSARESETLERLRILAQGCQGPTERGIEQLPITLCRKYGLGACVEVFEAVDQALRACDQRMVHASPSQVWKPMNLLHVAINVNDCPLDFILFLLKIMPEATKHQDENGNLPLHTVLGKIHTIAMSLKATETNNLSSNSQVLMKSCEIMREILLEFPGAISIADGQGRMPFQRFIASGAPCLW